MCCGHGLQCGESTAPCRTKGTRARSRGIASRGRSRFWPSCSIELPPRAARPGQARARRDVCVGYQRIERSNWRHMLLDVLAWFIILAAASVIGAGVLTVFGAYHLRLGDRIILGAWLGVVLLALGLLSLSLVAPLSPLNAGVVTTALVAAGWVLLKRDRHPESRRRTTPDVSLAGWEVLAGVACVAVGAAALASDPITLYD